MSISQYLVRSGGAAICALALSLSIAPAAGAAEPSSVVSAGLRVVNANGSILADHTQYGADTSLKTDPKANCFGPDTGGSGEKVKLSGETALGHLASGQALPELRPVSTTDAFDFGVGLCGIGKAVAPQTGFWYLKSDHVASQLGADQTVVSDGGEIVWFLVEDFNSPPPAELSIEGPVLGRVGKDIAVRVFEYADDGTKSPAAGVEVTGSAEPTDKQGRATIRNDAEDGPFKSAVVVTRKGAISDQAPICVGNSTVKCRGDDAAGQLLGSPVRDKIKTGATFVEVRAAGGNDKVDIRGATNPDTIAVDCGRGKKDKLIVDAGAPAPFETKCEKVIAR